MSALGVAASLMRRAASIGASTRGASRVHRRSHHDSGHRAPRGATRRRHHQPNQPRGWWAIADAAAYDPPQGGALDTHPIMSVKTGGRFTIRDLDLVVDEVDIGGAFIKVVRPKSEDDVLDLYVEMGREDADPYWAALWPSSIALAKGVAGVGDGVIGDGVNERNAMDEGSVAGSRGNLMSGMSVCDVGAGLGLAGLAAAMCGAKTVAFYDREPLALQCCLLSAEANGLAVVASESVGRDGDQDEPGESSSMGTVCVAEVFDWNNVSDTQRTFDLVLACDVLYETHAVSPVCSLIPKLTSERGRWMVADPPNRAPKNRAAFLAQAETDHGMTLVRERRTTVTRCGSSDDVLVLDLRLR